MKKFTILVMATIATLLLAVGISFMPQNQEPITAQAQTVASEPVTIPTASEGLKYTLVTLDGVKGYKVSKGTCTDTDVVIPSTYEGLPVISIGDSAFSSCDSLTIYCEAESKPSGWNSYWNRLRNYRDCPVYWAGEWEYVDGVPTPKA